jgi:hypothetical protein
MDFGTGNMNILERANEIVESVQEKNLTELWGRVESWKKCGCHKCLIEAKMAQDKYFDEYYFIKEKRHPNDERDYEVDYELTNEELEDALLSADMKEIEIDPNIDEESLVEFFLSLKFKDTLVCFKYCGEEIWIYYDKDGRPEEYGGRD